MSEDSIVSIIMPVYNGGEFLKDSVKDILAQTYKDIELFCIYDDGTTDGSDKVLDEMARKDSRLIVIRNEERGSNVCRNRGIKEAHGKYLMFLDADDRFEPDMIELLIDKADETGCDLVAFDGDVFDSESGIHKAAPWLIKGSGDPSVDDPFAVLNTTIWNKMYRRAHIVDNAILFNNPHNGFPTYFVFMAVVYAKRIELVRKVLIHYRVNNGTSLIANSDKNALGAYDEFVAMKTRLDADGRFDEKKSIFTRHAREYLFDRLHLMKTSKGYKELYDALHDEGIDKLSLDHADGVKGSYENMLLKAFCAIKENDCATFLYDNLCNIKKAGLLGKECWIMPDIKGLDVKVALYGGGEVGKDYFAQIMRRGDLSLVCWADRNYERIGFPLQSLEVLKEAEYDVLLIAVSDRKTADIITKDLLTMGIPEDKIFWRQPEYI